MILDFKAGLTWGIAARPVSSGGANEESLEWALNVCSNTAV